MSGFTKGPWKLSDSKKFIYVEHEVPNGGDVVCHAPNLGASLANWKKANASLIAAAPDMYEALGRCYEWLCTGEAQQSIYHLDTKRQVEAALAKAEGK